MAAARKKNSAAPYAECSDEILVKRLRAGEEEICDFLLERHKNMVRSKAQTMFLLGGDTEDLIQEGMIGLYQAIRSYEEDHDASFRTFAELCVTRKMYNAIESARSKKNTPLNESISLSERMGEGDSEFGELLPDTAAGPEEHVIDQERSEKLQTLMKERLTPMERKVLELYITGVKTGELAKLLGISAKAADNAIQRAKNKLKSGLQE